MRLQDLTSLSVSLRVETKYGCCVTSILDTVVSKTTVILMIELAVWTDGTEINVVSKLERDVEEACMLFVPTL